METRPTHRTPHEIAEIPPLACRNGHRFSGERFAFVGYLPCFCAGGDGHRTYRCATCDVIDYYPAHDETIQPSMHSAYDD